MYVLLLTFFSTPLGVQILTWKLNPPLFSSSFCGWCAFCGKSGREEQRSDCSFLKLIDIDRRESKSDYPSMTTKTSFLSKERWSLSVSLFFYFFGTTRRRTKVETWEKRRKKGRHKYTLETCHCRITLESNLVLMSLGWFFAAIMRSS